MRYHFRPAGQTAIQWEAADAAVGELLVEAAEIAGWRAGPPRGVPEVTVQLCAGPPPVEDALFLWPSLFERRFRLVRPTAAELDFYLDLTGLDSRQLIFFQRSIAFLPLARLLHSGEAVLAHGALAARGDRVIGICGESGAGKSTAMSRLPAGWHSFCDDAFLLFRREDGYFVQPLPTWSRSFYGLPKVRYEGERILPLQELFILARHETDSVEELPPLQQLLGIAPCLNFLYYIMARGTLREERRELRLKSFEFSRRLCRELPVRRLNVSLHGEFWRHLD